MYKIYNKNIIGKTILLLISIFLLFEDIIIVLPLVIKQGLNAKNAIILIFSVIIAVCLFKIAMAMNKKSYYSDIQQLKAINPNLVIQYENEFETAEKICENIWISNNFYYIRTATKLKIITLSQLREIVLYRTYSREACLDMDLFTDSEKITVTSYVGLSNKDKAIACAERLSYISSANLKINL